MGQSRVGRATAITDRETEAQGRGAAYPPRAGSREAPCSGQAREEAAPPDARAQGGQWGVRSVGPGAVRAPALAGVSGPSGRSTQPLTHCWTWGPFLPLGLNPHPFPRGMDDVTLRPVPTLPFCPLHLQLHRPRCKGAVRGPESRGGRARAPLPLQGPRGGAPAAQLLWLWAGCGVHDPGRLARVLDAPRGAGRLRGSETPAGNNLHSPQPSPQKREAGQLPALRCPWGGALCCCS